MKPIIPQSSIVRQIWSTTDIVLFIFAGASAEFALNKQVDWLYFTGRLPADPIGRLFSTIQYAQHIIFNDRDRVPGVIDRINTIHHSVETSRGKKIPESSYKDVLYMLMYYSIVSFELLERKMTTAEKDDVIQTFHNIGSRMNLENIPHGYSEWEPVYARHLTENLENSGFTKDLFSQYRKHLGPFRFALLLEIQRMMVSAKVNRLLALGRPKGIPIVIACYKLIRKYRLRQLLIRAMVPKKFTGHLRMLDRYESLRSME